MSAWTRLSLVLLWMACPVAFAQGPLSTSLAEDVATRDRPFQVEGYMFLTGRLATDGDGRVHWHEIDAADQVPEPVVAFVSRQAADWVIVTAGGDRVSTPLQMTFSISIRASPSGEGRYQLWRDGVSVEPQLGPDARIRVQHRAHPQYPRSLARIGAGGIVYLLLQLDEDGRVQEVFSRQIDLTTLPSDLDEAMWIQAQLGASAATAARRWRFRMPTEGEAARRPAIVGISVDYSVEPPPPAYGEWRYLVRGRHALPPWAMSQDSQAGEGLTPGSEPRPFSSSYRVRSTLAGAATD